MYEAGDNPTVLALIGEIERRLQQVGVSDARRHAEWMLQEVMGEDRAILYAYPDRVVSSEQVDKLRTWVNRRRQGEPIQYILGRAVFRGLRLHVSRDVLIPRPETEEVVEEALSCIAELTQPRVLDVGTGSGCIALAIKHARPDADVCAVDNSARALALARKNAEELGLAIRFLKADLLSDTFPRRVPGPYHLMISNPPYVHEDERETLPAEVLEHEPHEALFAGAEPLRFHRALCRHAQQLLDRGGWLVTEIHEDTGPEVAGLLEEHGFSEVRIVPDLTKKDRIAVGRWG